jgi:phenylalanyl-tRNA synthetase beta chain
MGVMAKSCKGKEIGSDTETDGVLAKPPEWRDDFLHAADVMEDVMIGRGMESFAPLTPSDFTIGRLTPQTMFSRKVKEILIGQGYQERIYNYVGSYRDLVEKMYSAVVTDDTTNNKDIINQRIIHIANPMTENYEYVRDSVLACLLESESVSAAAYPHKIFEVGKVAFKNDAENTGTSTRQYAGFLTSAPNVNFNTMAASVQNLFYYISRDYTLAESDDPRFISGRAAQILYQGKAVGVFGEIHPAVLEAWNITMPCAGAEVDLDLLL